MQAKYETIINYIKSEIKNNDIKPGTRLPSIRNIRDKFTCSKATVVKAYDLMEKEHIIYSIPKSGHYLIQCKLASENKVLNKVIDFSTAVPDRCILPYDEFQHCMDSAMEVYKNSLFSSSNTQGLPDLIHAAGKQLQNYQIFVGKENLFITSGSQQAINILTMMNFPNGGRNVLVEQPTYHGVLNSLKLNHVNTIGIKRNNSGIDFNELEDILKHGSIKFFYTIPRFHNPTGFSYSNKQKKIILELCRRYNVYIVEDDYLADLETNRNSYPMYALDMYAGVIYLKTYSKVLLPGLRISAAVLPEQLVKTFMEYKRWNDLSTSILSQGALEIYIRSGMFDENMKKFRRVYTERMDYLNRMTEDLENSKVKWHIPNSGFFASLELSCDVNRKFLIERLKEKNVLMSDPSSFYLKGYNGSGLMRLSVSSVSKEEIKKGIYAFMDEIK